MAMNILKTIPPGMLAVFFAAVTVSAQELNKLADADNGFAFDLLKQITTEHPRENIFISPFSVSTVLQMAGDGAAGETKAEMQHVLNTGNLSPEALKAACRAMNRSLEAQTNVVLNLANGIWYQKESRLKPDFIADNKNFFNAELAAVDFLDPAAAQHINDWADEKTHGKIQNVVRFPFPPRTKVILANAIYFKGKWAMPFDKDATRPRDFHLPDGRVKQAAMMSQRKKFNYLEGDGFQAVQLPYAGDRLQMYLFLPAAGSSPQKLLAGINGKDWRDTVLPKFSNTEGTVVFPKFKLDYDVSLNQSLGALGMKQAFSPQADFSAMADEPLFISQVKQKSFVAVDEEGTEAAAVTTVMMAGSIAMRPPKAFEMIADRPFFFVIADGQAGTILFMGLVNDPAE
jgi:serine protease inhibitor